MTPAPCVCVCVFSFPCHPICRAEISMCLWWGPGAWLSVSQGICIDRGVSRGDIRGSTHLVLFFSLSFCPSLPPACFHRECRPLSDVRFHAWIFHIIRNHCFGSAWYSFFCNRWDLFLEKQFRFMDERGDHELVSWKFSNARFGSLMLNPCFYQSERKESISANIAADFLPGSFVESSKLT